MKNAFEPLTRWLFARRARVRMACLLGGALAAAIMLRLCSRMEAPWFAFGFMALVPWLLALDRARTLREAALGAMAMSVLFVGGVFPWLPDAAQRYSDGSSLFLWLVMLLLAPLLEPQFITFALVRHVVRRAPGERPALRAALAAACAYVATELLFPKLFFDTLGLALYPSLHLRQAADIAGVHGLTLFLLLVNEAICASIRRWTTQPEPHATRARWSLVPLAFALGLVLAGYGYGFVRNAQITARTQAAPAHVLGIVQASITNYDKLRAEKGAFETVRTILDTHYALSDELGKRERLDLLVWPETVYPTTYGSPKSEAGAAFDAEIAEFAKSRGVPLVFGGYDIEGGREYNAAFFLTSGGEGRPSSSSYRKRMLFPLTEWVPSSIDSEWLREWMPWSGHWERGPGPRVVALPLRDGSRISVIPLICYDVLFSDFVAEAAGMGADLIVTISNDSWFPDERAPRLHLASAAFRSIETRLPQVRATNSGISAMITPTGQIIAETGWEKRQTLVASLAAAGRGATLAVTLGRYLGLATLGAALIVLLQSILRTRAAPPAQKASVNEGEGSGRKRGRGRNKRSNKAPR
jgi:apolipoprotein N-acyltransferase